MDKIVESMNCGIILLFLGVGIFLLREAVRDMQKQEISLVSCIVTAVIALLAQIPQISHKWPIVLAGISVGGMLLLVAAISRESIGYGDGAVFVTTGIALGGYRNILLLLYALFICCIVTIFLMLIRKIRRKSRIAFIPFVFPAYIGVLITEVLKII